MAYSFITRAIIDRSSRNALDALAVICVIAFMSSVYGAPPSSMKSLLIWGSALGFGIATAEIWLPKSSGRIALALMLGILIWQANVAEPFIKWDAGPERYRSVLALLFSVSLIQRVGKRANLGEALVRALRHAPSRFRGLSLASASAVLAVPLNLGAVALVTGIIGPQLRRPRQAALISMRAVSLTILLLPSTVAAATVSVNIPGLNAISVFLTGFPLFLLGLAILSANEIEPSDEGGSAPARAAAGNAHYRMTLIAAFGLGAGMVLAFGGNAAESVSAGGVTVFLAEYLLLHREWAACVADIRETIVAHSAEAVLLIVCGVLAASFNASVLPAVAKIAIEQIWTLPGVASAIVIMALPVVSALGVHPLIIFNLVFPIVDNWLLGDTTAQYIAWSSMFMGAQLISPVSISAIIAAQALHLTPTETSLKLHWAYAGALAVATWLYLTIINNIAD
jgi:hypothetical protein